MSVQLTSVRMYAAFYPMFANSGIMQTADISLFLGFENQG